MSKKRIAESLHRALLQDGSMDRELFDRDLQDMVDGLIESMIEDDEDYVFSVTEQDGAAAMVLVERDGTLHINEAARERLKALWPAAYASNLRMMIPDFASQLNRNEIPIFGMTVVDQQ
ncbi:MAG: hypothetical protein WBC44_04740 [Planctomycetaceae bacterium]